MSKKLWQVGLLGDEDPIYLGPFTKQAAEVLFKFLNDNPTSGMRPFIQRVSERRRSGGKGSSLR